MAEAKTTKKKINWSFYLAFVIATIAITKLFTSHKYFTAGDSVMAYSVIGVSIFFLLASCVFMAFEIYAEEKEKSNLRVNFPIFEYMYKRFKVN